MVRPSSMAVTMVPNESSTRIMSAASLDTSVPVIPMATPMSARLSAGASLTPSPVMATISPCFLRARTIFNLCSGLTRAKINSCFFCLSRLRSFRSVSWLSSSPVTTFTFEVWTMLSFRAIAWAVAP